MLWWPLPINLSGSNKIKSLQEYIINVSSNIYAVNFPQPPGGGLTVVKQKCTSSECKNLFINHVLNSA